MEFPLPITAKGLADFCGAEIVGDPSAVVKKCVALADLEPQSLSFYSNKKTEPKPIPGAVVLASREFVKADAPFTYLVVKNPQLAFARILKEQGSKEKRTGISSKATVHESAQISPEAWIDDFAYVGPGAVIGKSTRIYPFVYVGEEVIVGSDCELHPHVVLMPGTELGDRVKLFSGTVIGSDGFGLIPDEKGHLVEMPQVGGVKIGNDVRMGSNCTVDKGTLRPTLVGNRCKFDDHVHVGHNCVIGEDVVMCGAAAVGGSSSIEDRVVLGGQVGVGDNVRIGKGAQLGAQCGAAASLDGGEAYWLTPAVPVKESLRVFRASRKLPELLNRVKELEAEIAKISHQINKNGSNTLV